MQDSGIKIVKTIDDMHQEATRLGLAGKTIALVPTMGFLHEGHLALIREAQRHGDTVVVSIFVNPTQFGPTEDFKAYPRDFNRDLYLARSAKADVIFAPSHETMYDNDHETFVQLKGLPDFLCGPSRPGHFRGVTTVVTKLFNIVKPQVALFGEKDYQQLVIIRRLTRDLSFDIRIIGVPTVREPDGLAMSSRNAYLSQEERLSALSLYQGLQIAKRMVTEEGITEANRIKEEISRYITSHPYTKIDYVALCNQATLKNINRVKEETLIALAVWVGTTRLIDNIVLKPR
ncbi:MAG: pantoate--beta-alanine ligase [Deltaproteobacteria bacterium]|nr:pantoate--beta-alanine ligase [Deltaproteobacteria bacterium]